MNSQPSSARTPWLTQRKNELACAVSFLTRLPPALKAERPALAACVWAFPVAGALVGLIGGVVLAGSHALGAPPLVAGFLALGAMVLASGALHEDGLSDTADGLGGGRDREHALTIMRDSRIGAYGAATLIVALGLRAAALAALAATPVALLAPVVGGAIGRAGGALMLGLLGPARPDGLGAGAGTPDRRVLGAGLALTVLLALVTLPVLPAVAALALAVLPVLAVARLAQRKVGGHTGDIIGAGALGAEITALVVLAAWVGSVS
ncbi:adenosylcobinamide-GDP ribazoletransferase [Pararhodospirillum photometricum]|uniref:Adenosylcobinamide-GDP ribazoletransferase n=1 Tax=Pararhodospirillum photometricum DSM 122 TaxID=1150469 RepID=H6SJL3_PARPM|nr:adenosylcobinamide-GDP ribazoletransferase [Pararhodospirillum photometricum]CCG08178.1 Cobalamin-5'-phosphate synthase [Pararhodospirillum photometricum DSM 122]